MSGIHLRFEVTAIVDGYRAIPFIFEVPHDQVRDGLIQAAAADAILEKVRAQVAHADMAEIAHRAERRVKELEGELARVRDKRRRLRR